MPLGFQQVVDIQQKIIYFLISVIVAFGLTYYLNTPDLDKAQIYVLFLLFLSIGLWITEAVPPFAVGLMIYFKVHHIIEFWAVQNLPTWLLDFSVIL